MSSILTEVCVDSVDGVRAAAEAGADRVELCVALSEGGLTPSAALIDQALEVAGQTKVHVLIRPRGGDFHYTANELRVMRSDLERAERQGVHGVVIGALTPDGRVDSPAITEILTNVGPTTSVTFHRAVDMSADPIAAIRQLTQLPIQRVLTSGGYASAPKGAAVINRMRQEAGANLTVLAGGGIRAHNVADLVAATGVTEVHFTAFRADDSPMTYRNTRMALGHEDYLIRRTDSALVREIRGILDSLPPR